MTKYNDRDDHGDNDGNEDGNDKGNAAAGSVYDRPIFDPIKIPRSRLGVTGESWETTATSLCLRRTMYLQHGL